MLTENGHGEVISALSRIGDFIRFAGLLALSHKFQRFLCML